MEVQFVIASRIGIPIGILIGIPKCNNITRYISNTTPVFQKKQHPPGNKNFIHDKVNENFKLLRVYNSNRNGSI